MSTPPFWSCWNPLSSISAPCQHVNWSYWLGLVQVTTVAISSGSQRPWRHFGSTPPQPLALTFFLPCLPQSPWASKDVPFRAVAFHLSHCSTPAPDPFTCSSYPHPSLLREQWVPGPKTQVNKVFVLLCSKCLKSCGRLCVCIGPVFFQAMGRNG